MKLLYKQNLLRDNYPLLYKLYYKEYRTKYNIDFFRTFNT